MVAMLGYSQCMVYRAPLLATSGHGRHPGLHTLNNKNNCAVHIAVLLYAHSNLIILSHVCPSPVCTSTAVHLIMLHVSLSYPGTLVHIHDLASHPPK